VGIGMQTSSSNTAQQTTSSNGIVGTGFVISKGLIATNHHVVSEDGVKYFVKAEGVESTFEVKKIYEDAISDIAIIQIDDNGKLTPLDLGDSKDLKVGQEVIAIGNPLGDLPGTVTSGIISALDRSVSVTEGGFYNSTVQNFDGVIQTDAAINPGNSGGPLIDMNGNVIGINFATVEGANNLSFALPISRIKDRLNEIKQYGEFRIPYFGVQYRDRVLFFNNKMLYAAQILAVETDSPADKAGVKQGDYVVGVNGKDLDNKSLDNYIQSSKIGDKVELNIIRGEKEVKLTVTVGVKGK
jgi:serine protease Do